MSFRQEKVFKSFKNSERFGDVKGTQYKSFNGLLQVKFVKTNEKISKVKTIKKNL